MDGIHSFHVSKLIDFQICSLSGVSIWVEEEGEGEGEGGGWVAGYQSDYMPPFFSTGCQLHYEQTVMEVNEDAGEIELLQISKHGETELPVKIYITGSTYNK